MVDLACRGNLTAIIWIVERTGGKIPERIEQRVTAEHSVGQDAIDAVLAGYAQPRQPLSLTMP